MPPLPCRPGPRTVGQHEVAAGRERVAQGGHDPPGIFGIGDEVLDHDEQQPGRLAEVD